MNPFRRSKWLSPIDRFMERFIPEPNSGCWLWLGSVDDDGYGKLVWDGGTRAHRFSYEHFVGSLRGQVLHRCDNPYCVNPDHLFLGTGADNMADKTAKRRNNAPRGECQHSCKLTPSEIVSIRQRSNESRRKLAAEYHISPAQLSRIINGKNWSHV